MKIPAQKTPYFSHGPIHLTARALPFSLKAQDLEAYHVLHEQTQKRPKKALKPIEELIERAGETPELLNLYAYALIRSKKLKQAEEIMKKNFEKHPENLLVRINYGDQLLRGKDLKSLQELFPTSNLRELFPQKKTFHVSEYRSFMVLMGFYHLEKGEEEVAAAFHYLAHSVDKNHPAPKLLAKKLFKKRWYQLCTRQFSGF